MSEVMVLCLLCQVNHFFPI